MLNSCHKSCKVAFIGFGEVAATLFESVFARSDIEVSVYALSGRKTSIATAARLARCGLVGSTATEVLSEASIVISTVPPSAAVGVARHASPHLRSGTVYLDLNSVAGQTVAEVANCVEESGARCVDGAIMGPVPLLRSSVPIVLSGVAAGELNEFLRALGLNTSVISDRVGDASSLKMLWSVITKGTIALLAESLLAAHRLGLLEYVRQLLAEEYGKTGSDTMILRMLGSSTGAGCRRVDEMTEAEKVLLWAGVPSWSTGATRRWLHELSLLSPPGDASAVEGLVKEISTSLGSRHTTDSPVQSGMRTADCGPGHPRDSSGGR